MSENEIIVLAGRDLFRAGISIGMGTAVGAFIAIAIYQLVATGIEKIGNFLKRRRSAQPEPTPDTPRSTGSPDAWKG